MPKIFPGDLVTFEIKVNGRAIADDIGVLAIRVEQSINKISLANITVSDGNAAVESFPVSESKTFIPGNEITIEAGYNVRNKVIFTGIVTKQIIRADNENGSLLEVECKDKAVKMTVGRKSKVYKEMNDSDVIQQLIANAGLASQVESTSTTIAELVQYYVSDWDFMIARAEVNGLMVSTINGKVVVSRPDQINPALTLTYGEDLISFKLSLNAISQLAQVKASAWDYKDKKVISAQADNSFTGPGNLSSKKLSEVVSLDIYELQTVAPVNAQQLKNWAEAQMLKSQLSKITGMVQSQGLPDIKPGNYIELEGLGARFNGNHFVSSVRHEIAEGQWTTDFELGLSADWYVQEKDIEAAAAAGLLPGIHGLYTGVVKQIKNDPDSQNRILVEVPLFSESSGIWARFAGDHLINVKKNLFFPEVGDEVILGFLNQDPRFPVILGTMYKQNQIANKGRILKQTS